MPNGVLKVGPGATQSTRRANDVDVDISTESMDQLWEIDSDDEGVEIEARLSPGSSKFYPELTYELLEAGGSMFSIHKIRKHGEILRMTVGVGPYEPSATAL